MSTLAARIHAILRQHRGAEAAISAPQICARLGESNEREIRRQIDDHAPRWPDLVCAIPGKGYFVADDIEEAERYDNWLSQLVERAICKRKAFRAACRQLGMRVPTPAAKAA